MRLPSNLLSLSECFRRKPRPAPYDRRESKTKKVLRAYISEEGVRISDVNDDIKLPDNVESTLIEVVDLSSRPYPKCMSPVPAMLLALGMITFNRTINKTVSKHGPPTRPESVNYEFRANQDVKVAMKCFKSEGPAPLEEPLPVLCPASFDTYVHHGPFEQIWIRDDRDVWVEAQRGTPHPSRPGFVLKLTNGLVFLAKKPPHSTAHDGAMWGALPHGHGF
ncbi:hypothetical protein K488DRAFT_86297 [Vararia minispora EC-137]|uniref:Uncharacterized protein n=1 Tax=Vararia minispora EC-137 TaxID=1314806 RepID=A0ACB8QJX6_9AGAM|nr:hypothetical protein K488DRAFT_86297 [Vararia minispora EC-137]